LIGEVLKTNRERLGLDLKTMAHDLKIQYEHLRALEDNNFEKLPPDVYTKGYIREYARVLNVDPEPLIHEYTEYLTKKVGEVPKAPHPPKRSISLPLILFSFMIILGIVSGLIIYSPKSKEIPPPPQQVDVPPAPQQIEVPAPPQQIEVPAPSPDVGQPLLQHTLEVVATETTWLQIEMEDGSTEEVLMRPEETKEWTTEGGFSIKLGNAGGVRLVLDGRDMGTPGKKGQVIRLTLP
jgi:cytoskeletal protein RodZ